MGDFIKQMREMARKSMSETKDAQEMKEFIKLDELGEQAEKDNKSLEEEVARLKSENEQLMSIAKKQILKESVSDKPKGEEKRSLAQVMSDYLKKKSKEK